MQQYLTDIPQFVEEYGMCKTLAVRHDVIHVKHIFTEIFTRKTIDIDTLLNSVNMNLFSYMEYMTHRLRHIHYFSRDYKQPFNDIVKTDRSSFFSCISVNKGLNDVACLDFDGTVNSKNFRNLYELTCARIKTYIVTANPTVTEEWFIKNQLPMPDKIFACKGKLAKINTLLDINKKHSHIYFVDNESKYLDITWIFGIYTFEYRNNKIYAYTKKTK